MLGQDREFTMFGCVGWEGEGGAADLESTGFHIYIYIYIFFFFLGGGVGGFKAEENKQHAVTTLALGFLNFHTLF